MFSTLATAGTLSAIAGIIGLVMLALLMMPKMADPTIPTPQDASLLLQDTVTKTVSFNSAALDLGAGFAPGGRGTQVAAALLVTAVDRTTGDETYSFVLQQSNDNSSFAAVGVAVSVSAIGMHLAKGIITQRYVRVVLTAAGTTPSVTYKAWLNPL
jgi:hypothetical protein